MKQEEKNVVEQFLVPFFHLSKRLPLFPGKNSPEAEATILGLTQGELELNRQNLEMNARQAALELLKEEEVIELVNKLPFDGSETIVAFGDSFTEDDQSWFNIFCKLLEIAVEDADFKFINSGIAGNTTTDALRRIDRDVLLHEPDWVFIALGTFDAQRLNILPSRTLIPLSETWENLNSIQQILEEHVQNPLVWIPPAPVITQLMEDFPLHEFVIHAEDLNQITELVIGKTGGIVDPKGERMGEGEPKAWNYLTDGLHPSLSGHINTVREVLKTLVEVKVEVKN